MTTPPNNRTNGVAGFTLLELLVVLVILTVIARTAVVALDGAASEEWRSSTIRGLEAAETAILGRPDLKQPGDLPWVEGFVADVGRLPRVDGDDVARGDSFAELWKLGALNPYSLQTALGDPQVRMPVGWRGPYLRLGVGKTAWFDGFGRAFEPLDANGEVAPDGDPIYGVRSGAEAGADDLVEDLVVSFVVDGIERHVGTVPVTVIPAAGGGGTIVLRLYGPEDGVLDTLQQLDQLVVDGGGAPEPLFFAFENVSIGHRMIRAYQSASAPARDDDPIPVGIRSDVVPVAVVPGGVPMITLDLRNP